tara:strand:+ start:1787 stop:2074 length:288 start_codon:yes stop_codon:yes gene_type:complete
MPVPSVQDFPYLFQNPSGLPTYCKSHPEAIKLMQKQIQDLKHQFGKYEGGIVFQCAEAEQQVSRLGASGGRVDVKLSESIGLRYEMVLHKRDSIL